MTRKQLGRIGLSMAINYFTNQGYTISIPLNDTQWYDLVIEKDGIFQTVQCKATSTEDDTISLVENGGTKGTRYSHVFDHDKLDLLFCVNKNLDMWLIPIKDMINNKVKLSICLRKEKNSNGQGFNTYLYQVFLR